MDDITPLTPQQVFDNALFGIRKQGYAQSIKLDGTACLYESDNGRRCVIGHSVPNAALRALMDNAEFSEGSTITNILGSTAEELAPARLLFSQCPLDFLERLQTIHDDLGSFARVGLAWGFEEEMKDLAEIFDLTYTPPEAA